MPFIPQVQEQVREFTRAPEAAQHPQLDRAQGEAVSNLGQAMEHLGAELSMAQHHKDTIDAANMTADWEDAANKGKQSIQMFGVLPDDNGDPTKKIPPGTKTMGQYQAGLKDAADAIRSNEQYSEGAKALFTSQANKLYEQKYQPQTFAEVAKSIYGNIQTQNDTAIAKRAQMVFSDPSMYSDSMHEVVNIISNSPLNPEMKEKQTHSAIAAVNDRMIGGYAQRGQFDEARAFMQRSDVVIDPEQAKQWDEKLNDRQQKDMTFKHTQKEWQEKDDDRALKDTSQHILATAIDQLGVADSQGTVMQIDKTMRDALVHGAVRQGEFDIYMGMKQKVATTPNDASWINQAIYSPVNRGDLNFKDAKEALIQASGGQNPMISSQGAANAWLRLNQMERMQKTDPVFQDQVKEGMNRIKTFGKEGDVATRALNGVYDNTMEAARVDKQLGDFLQAVEGMGGKGSPMPLANNIAAGQRGLNTPPTYKGETAPTGVTSAAGWAEYIETNRQHGKYNSPEGKRQLNYLLKQNLQHFDYEMRKNTADKNANGGQ